jgi:hypothetical protein
LIPEHFLSLFRSILPSLLLMNLAVFESISGDRINKGRPILLTAYYTYRYIYNC